MWFTPRMSIETLKREAAALPLEERQHLMGFLVSLNVTEEEREEMARKIDDRDPKNWLSLEQLDEKLKALDEAENR